MEDSKNAPFLDEFYLNCGFATRALHAGEHVGQPQLMSHLERYISLRLLFLKILLREPKFLLESILVMFIRDLEIQQLSF